METLYTLLLVLQVMVSIALICFILLQHGKGADAGAAFGSGASATVFGSRGAGNFMTNTTAVLAIIFLANSLLLGYLAASAPKNAGSLLDDEPPAAVIQEKMDAQPATDVPADVPADTATSTSADVPAASMDTPTAETPSVEAPAESSAVTDVPADVPVDIPTVPQE